MLGILAIPLFAIGILGVLGLVFGLIGLRRVRRDHVSGFGLAVAGLVLSGCGLVFFVAFLWFVGSDLSDRETVAWRDLQGGECINRESSNQAEVVSCRIPHESEVYAVIQDRASSETAYPGRLELVDQADDACEPRYALYVGIPYEDSEFISRPVVPTESQWALGDRWIVCLVERENGRDLLSSVRDSER